MGRSGPDLIHGSLGVPEPIRVLNPNGILIGSAVFAGLTSETYRPTLRPTDHAARSVTRGRIYIRSTALRPNNIINSFLYRHTTLLRYRDEYLILLGRIAVLRA